jgi:XTP/dITP diphosphohydrolase
MIKQLLLATSNTGKRKEISDILKTLQVELLTPPDIALEIEVDETGETYLENAMLKALAYCQAANLPTLADDSGLEVAALGGAPGLHSARFSPKPNASDRDRRLLLLSKLNGRERPWTAQFVCTVILALPGGETYNSTGVCPGEIIPEERGSNGFGYDPIFFIPEKGKTMAELGMEVKNRISHRGRALLGIIPTIEKL